MQYIRWHCYIYLVFLTTRLPTVVSVVLHVNPSSTGGECPTGSCITLSHFALNSSSYQESNVSLVLLPGNHTLHTSMLLSTLNEFHLQGSLEAGEVKITCDESLNFTLNSINRVHIDHVKFVGCQGSRFESIGELFLDNLAFTDSQLMGTTLELVGVRSTNIKMCTFASNSGGAHRSQTEFLEFMKNEYSTYSDIDTRANVGGAMIITRSNVVIIDCHFEDNWAGLGGALYSEISSNVTIRSSNFTQNRVLNNCEDTPCHGGAIVVNSGSSLSVYDSHFWNNSNTGAILLLSATAYISRTTFSDNRARSGGAFFLYDTTLVVEGSSFLRNVVTRLGGAIYAGRRCSIGIYDTVFEENKAWISGVLLGDKGCEIRAENCIFTNNKAIHSGGVFYNVYSNTTVHSNTFHNNTANQSGGVLYIPSSAAGSSNVSMLDNLFLGNRAAIAGGAMIVYNSNVVVRRSTFASNAAASGSVVYARKGSTIVIGDAQFNHNLAERGTINAYQSVILVNGSTFTRNNASVTGGFASIGQSMAHMTNSRFMSNFATQGAVLYSLNATALCRNCTCSHNTATTNGGAIDAQELSNITIINSVFTFNNATFAGVASVSGSVFTLENSTFENNTATYEGAVLYIYQGLSSTVNNTLFQNNWAGVGGVIYTAQSHMTVSHSSFFNNTAERGGTAYVAENSHMIILRSTLSDNTALVGGGLSLSNNSFLEVHDSTFNRNSAASEGGVMYVVVGSTAVILKSEFVGNYANDGGIMLAHQSNTTLAFCRVSLNRADTQGGVFHVVDNSYINLVSSEFVSNVGFLYGGVMMAAYQVSITMTNCTFVNNSADNGGVLSPFNTDLTIEHCTFLNNSAQSFGAAFYSLGFATANITGSWFTSNTAGLRGGVISLMSTSQMSIRHCTFDSNLALDDGGVIYGGQNSGIVIHDSIFTNNRAGLPPLLIHDTPSNASLHSEIGKFNNGTGGAILVRIYSTVVIYGSQFMNNTADYGGALCGFGNSILSLTNCSCTQNSAVIKGGVLYANESKIILKRSTLNNNKAGEMGGVLMGDQGNNVSINNCAFINNSAKLGAALHTSSNNIVIGQTAIHGNRAEDGVLNLYQSDCIIFESTFSNNIASNTGGTAVLDRGTLSVTDSEFTENSAAQGGVLYGLNASVALNYCNIHRNMATINGGALSLFFQSKLTTTYTNFSHNTAQNDGGVVFALVQNTLIFNNGQFRSNQAGTDGGVFFISFQTTLILSTSIDTWSNNSNVCSDRESAGCIPGMILENNKAPRGAVMFSNDFSFVYLTGEASIDVHNNSAQLGVFYVYESVLNSSTILGFKDNVEGVHAEKSSMLFTGTTSFLNCSASHESSILQHRQGGAVKSISCDISFDGHTTFEENTAESGAAVHAIESNVSIGGEILVTRNRVTLKGGGFCLVKSKLSVRGRGAFAENQASTGGALYSDGSFVEVFEHSKVDNNHAQLGGGLYVKNSRVVLHGNLTIASNRAVDSGGGAAVINTTIVGGNVVKTVDNEAKSGGGFSLDGNTKLYQTANRSVSETTFVFTANRANVGGALFMADETNEEVCAYIPNEGNASQDTTECFFFTSTPQDYVASARNFKFSQNVAQYSGDDLYGGLLDRCTATHLEQPVAAANFPPSGLTFFQTISNMTSLESIGSLPVRICFCVNDFPNCSHQQPTIGVKSGELFSFQLVALDQANHVVNATILASLSTSGGRLGESESSQNSYETCTELSYSVFSSTDYAELYIYADGPCGSNGISKMTVEINIVPCSCPIGFEISSEGTNECVCGCHSDLAAYIKDCDLSRQSVVRHGNYWVTHVNTTATSGYLVYPNCPLDYCHLPTMPIHVDLNSPNGSDAQCTSNKAGLLCGACQEGLSLSLGSSRCITCPVYWPGVMILILLFAFLAGIGLVASLLVLNLTVAVGTINALIFYANIVEAFKSTFFPSSTTSFASVIVSWLNLELGFDVCLFEGMDKYSKTWLQLAFPTYVILLVGVIIITTQYSTRLSELVGKKNPVATLATLILLSYAKLLQVVITALSFATLDYPDGSRRTVWLPDASVGYFNGKHSALSLVAICILFIGVLFTVLLFSWQWLLRLPDRSYFNWIKNQKLHFFMESYNAPYNLRHRYWTGLLLLVRATQYFISAVNVSGDPRVTYLTLIFITGGLITGKWILRGSIYKVWHNDILEGVTHVNLLIFTAYSWYSFETGKNQSIAAHISVLLTMIQLLAVIAYHMYTETTIPRVIGKLKNRYFVSTKNDIRVDDRKPKDEERERLRRTSTFSVVEVPRPENPQMMTAREREGLANIELHDSNISGTIYINPLFSHSEELEREDSTQADFILDELGIRETD